MNFPCVHHIEVGVTNKSETVDLLVSRFGFKIKAVRDTDMVTQSLLVMNDTRFLITSFLHDAAEDEVEKDDYVVDWMSPRYNTASLSHNNTCRKDSVFNVAFQVKDIKRNIHILEENNATFSKSLRTIKDPRGDVKACTIKSCVGDVYHTLIDKGDFDGCFLPGFTPVQSDDNTDILPDNDNADDHGDITASPGLLHFDHVALAVDMGTSTSVIEWYERFLGMKRFLINSEEAEGTGLVLSTDNVGLRLKAMEYWRCTEVGLVSPGDSNSRSECLSMVIAEGLAKPPGATEDNQIESWLRQHGGPGIQHVAITTTDIKWSVKHLKQAGVLFATPPPAAYYSQIGRLPDIRRVQEDADTLRELGILIDTEADGRRGRMTAGESKEIHESYLLQIFTRPLLAKDPFFMELIQRNGATGFGSGNVAALYRSVQAYIIGTDP